MTSDAPQRLLFVTTGLGSGGAEAMLAQIVTRLDRSRFHCAVASLASGGKHVASLRESGIEVHDLGMKPGRPSLAGLLRLRKIASAFEPESLIGWMYHGNLAATLLQRGKLKHAPLVWNVRQSLYSLEAEKRGSAMVIRFLARLSRRPRAIVYNSSVSARQHEAVGYDSDRTQVVPNGFDTQRFQPDPSARAKIRMELHLDDNAFLIGRIGRNAAMKDHPTALAAAAKVCRNHPQVHMLLAGTGMESADPAFADFLKRQPGVQSQIHFLGERHDLPQLTAALDLAISSSAFGEGFPNVVGEAMACGVPVIATDIGDTAIVLGDTGTLVPPADSKALALACESLIRSSAEHRQELGRRARHRIETQFSIDQVLRQYEALFTPNRKPETSNEEP